MLTTPPPSWATWQRVVNDVGVRDAPRRPPIPVLARVVWSTDGEEYVPGHATAWTRSEVLVELRDARCSTIGAWLPVADVRRRPPEPDDPVVGADAAPAPAVAAAGAAVTPRLHRLEYAVEELPLASGAPALERVLTARARDGWRLRGTTVARTLLVIFERPSRR